ncbi:MAG: transglutaminase domain-containing protein [Deltaproteobacteria bacterium]|nr:transglutaminase domain-containing protein [Deltaproteobacteria bacterium]
MEENLQRYLESTFYLDYYAQEVSEFSRSTCTGLDSPMERAIALYYAVRDQIRYDPYDLQYSRTGMRASNVVKKKSGYCVSKAVLLAAVARHQRIPSRLGFADVTNHLSTDNLKKQMGTDLFIYHGYTEMLLNGKWVKATPAFNLSLCTRFNVKPLEFDGKEGSFFHEFDTLGQKHMEYVRDHGHFADLPFDRIFSALDQTYPNIFDNFSKKKQSDFAAEASLENRKK